MRSSRIVVTSFLLLSNVYGQTHDGDLFVASSLLKTTSKTTRLSRAWVARYNAPGNDHDEAQAVAVDDADNVYVAGNSSDASGGFDYLTVKYNKAGIEQWTARYNGTGNDVDVPYVIVVDGAGNVYVSGYSTGSGSMYDMVTIKYNNTGSQLWVARYNGPGNNQDEVHDMAIDKSGNVYVTGHSTSINNAADFTTIKYNNMGVQQWIARYNGPGNARDVAGALEIDRFGNVYVSGFSAGPSGSGMSAFDYATVKYNNAGIEQWNIRYNGEANDRDEVFALAVDDSGNAYVTGFSYSSSGYPDYVTIKYDRAGVEKWVARYNGPGNGLDIGRAIAVDDAENVYVTGYSTGISSKWDCATIKYNKSGVKQWDARYNGPGNGDDIPYRLKLDDSNNVYVTGTSYQGSLGYDYATIKYNSAGVEQWSDRYNGPGNGFDQAQALAVDSGGNVYVTGQSMGSTGGQDYVTIKYLAIESPSGKPDLVITALAVNSWTSNSIRYSYTITNIGTAPANLDGPTNANSDNVSVQTFLSADTIFNNAGDIAAGGTILGVSPLGELAPGESFSGSFGASANVDPLVTPYLTLKVDWGRVVDESDETNNDAWTLIDSILAAPALVSPTNGAIDRPTTLTLSWNAASGANTYRLQVATNNTFTKVIFDDSTITGASRQVGSLANNTTYYWRVNARNNIATSPYSTPSRFTTNATVSVSTSLFFPANPTASTEYRLFSVPGLANSLTVSDLLPAGTPKIDWRMYRDNGAVSNYLIELSSMSALNTGEGYWLLNKGNLNVAREVTMPRLSTDATYSIALHSGWNIIGNPFDKSVSWSAVLAANGLHAATALQAYEGSYRASTTFEPFKGYYFFNSTNLASLKIPYPFERSNSQVVASPPITWKVQLVFEGDINRDQDNYIGIAPIAKVGRDELDSRKPPLFLDQSFLYFSRPAWDQEYSRFCSDFRPELSEGQVWEFEVSNPRKSKGRMCFAGLEQIPAEYDVRLINLQNSIVVDLRAQNEYCFQTISEKMAFKVIVGKKTFTQNEVSATVPKEFQLQQNFPNPFNPTTTITFSVPREAQIRLEILSVLGQHMKTLAEGRFTRAMHTIVWDGTDQFGQRVASGVYLCRLSAEGHVIQTRKMIFVE